MLNSSFDNLQILAVNTLKKNSKMFQSKSFGKHFQKFAEVNPLEKISKKTPLMGVIKAIFLFIIHKLEIKLVKKFFRH